MTIQRARAEKSTWIVSDCYLGSFCRGLLITVTFTLFSFSWCLPEVSVGQVAGGCICLACPVMPSCSRAHMEKACFSPPCAHLPLLSCLPSSSPGTAAQTWHSLLHLTVSHAGLPCFLGTGGESGAWGLSFTFCLFSPFLFSSSQQTRQCGKRLGWVCLG